MWKTRWRRWIEAHPESWKSKIACHAPQLQMFCTFTLNISGRSQVLDHHQSCTSAERQHLHTIQQLSPVQASIDGQAWQWCHVIVHGKAGISQCFWEGCTPCNDSRGEAWDGISHIWKNSNRNNGNSYTHEAGHQQYGLNLQVSTALDMLWTTCWSTS